MAKSKDKLVEVSKKFGRKGGKKTLELHGKEHFRKAVNIRWSRARAQKIEIKKVHKSAGK